MPLKTASSETGDADLDPQRLAELTAHIRRVLQAIVRSKKV